MAGVTVTLMSGRLQTKKNLTLDYTPGCSF